jgi:hypothetical protein
VAILEKQLSEYPLLQTIGKTLKMVLQSYLAIAPALGHRANGGIARVAI